MHGIFFLLSGLFFANEGNGDIEFIEGDTAYLCYQDSLHSNWPEFFAYQVKVKDVLKHRYKVVVTNSFPMAGRVNEEQTLTKGDVIKVSKSKIHSKVTASVKPGKRFDGKPVCQKFMSK